MKASMIRVDAVTEQVIYTELRLHPDACPITLTRDEAIELACRLAFKTCSDLTGVVSSRGGQTYIDDWNPESKFLKVYRRMFIGHEFDK